MRIYAHTHITKCMCGCVQAIYKWEHLKETIFKRKMLFSIVKEGTRLKKVIRG